MFEGIGEAIMTGFVSVLILAFVAGAGSMLLVQWLWSHVSISVGWR